MNCVIGKIVDDEENLAIEEFRVFFSQFEKKISADPEFKKHEDKLKEFGIRIIEITARMHQSVPNQTIN